MTCPACKDKELAPANEKGTVYLRCGSCDRPLNKTEKQRSPAQNNSIHLYCRLLAEEMDRQGVTLQNIVEAIKKAEIRPTEKNIKTVVWHEMQKAMFGKTSTTELTTDEVDRVYEMINAFLPKIPNYDGTHIPFPSQETLADTYSPLNTEEQ